MTALALSSRRRYVNPMTLRETFGKRFAEIRKRKGWSMADTGKRFDPPVSPTYIFQLEHGIDNPTLDQVERVAAVFGVRPQRLLSPTRNP